MTQWLDDQYGVLLPKQRDEGKEGLWMTKVEEDWKMAESGRAGQVIEAAGLDVPSVGDEALLG